LNYGSMRLGPRLALGYLKSFPVLWLLPGRKAKEKEMLDRK